MVDSLASRKDLHVLFVGQLSPCTGGAAIVGTQLLAGFVVAGYSVRAVVPRVSEAAWTAEQCAKANPGVLVSCFPAPDCVHGWFRHMDETSRRQERRVVRELLGDSIASARPDIVVFGKTPYAWHAADLVAAANLPSLLVCQGAWAADLPGRAGAPDLLGQLRLVDRIVTVAKHMVEPLQGLGLANVSAVPNGIDLERFAPRRDDGSLRRRLGLTLADVVVVHASNLVEAKRPLDVVRAAALARSAAPELAFVIVGDGRGRAPLEDFCRSADLVDRVRFTGWVEHEKMADYLNLADIVVMTSESEALPLIYLEAQACGRALVASDIPASREVIVHGETGLLFPMGDIPELLSRLLAVARDPVLRRGIGAKAREAAAVHDLNRTVADYLEIVAQLATSRAPGVAGRHDRRTR
jgi:glycosyltransferase involved in cell wall biosynthesis